MSQPFWPTNGFITTWAQFEMQISSRGCSLLKRLDDFPDSVLVTGCQRSGTTMLTRVITQSDGMTNYWFSPDDELDAALILSGYVNYEPEGRYCFQTTYNNKCYHEYFEHHRGHKIIWVLRNPYSVVYSLLYNWGGISALGSLFEECGVPHLSGSDYWLYKIFGVKGVHRLRQACMVYVGKTMQLFDLKMHFTADTLMVVDYDDLVTRKETMLPFIYRFINLDYQEYYLGKISSESLDKAKLLSKWEISTIRTLCEPIYQTAKYLAA